jgi:hypothetical protein
LNISTLSKGGWPRLRFLNTSVHWSQSDRTPKQTFQLFLTPGPSRETNRGRQKKINREESRGRAGAVNGRDASTARLERFDFPYFCEAGLLDEYGKRRGSLRCFHLRPGCSVWILQLDFRSKSCDGSSISDLSAT